MKKASTRILHFVESFGGGVFTFLCDLVNNLSQDDGYEIYIAHAIREQTPKDYQKFFNEKITLIRVKNFVRPINPIKDFNAMIEMRNIVDSIKPDIIHLHSSKAGALGRIVFNGKKIPVYYTPHGYSFLMQNQNYIKRLLYKGIEKLCGMRSAVTISCSLGEHKESTKLCKSAVYVNNGVNVKSLQKILNTVEIKPREQLTVVTLGRITNQKNPELFNNIAQKLPNIKFVWIGDGELSNVLTSSNIEVTGWLNREEAIKYALEGDVFLLTSLWEGLPIALLEAMYMKKLCIVSNVIGNRDVIHNQINGFVCNTLEEYIDAIMISENKEKVEEITENAKQSIMSEYNTNVMSDKYKKIYSGCISEL